MHEQHGLSSEVDSPVGDSSLFRELLDALPVAAYTCDADGLITFFNHEATVVWGRSARLNDASERWCGAVRLHLVSDGSVLPNDKSSMAEAIRTGAPQDGCELVVERPDGTRLTVLTHARPIRDAHGHVTGGVCTLTDINERKEAEVVASRLGAIVESSDDAVIGKTLTGQIVSWNTGAERIFGYTAEEAIGNHITMIIPDERRGEEREILAKLVAGTRVDHYETIRRHKNGDLLDISLTSSPIRDAKGVIIGASKIARDITLRRRNEASLKQLHEELRQADRAKNDFLATLAHELRNPLAPIRNLLTLLASARSLDDLPDALAVFNRQVSQLTRLIDDLMDVSRISKGKLDLRMERVDLRDAIQVAIESSAAHISAANHDFAAELPANPIMVDADADRLAQAICNLLNNAAKYTPAGGRIRISAHQDGSDAVVLVTDNGIGIPHDMLERVFDMFVQVDGSASRSHGGLGVGLHLASSLVGMHHGSLTATSDGVDRGSTFRLALPMAARADRLGPDTPATPFAPGVPARAQYRILVVDDNRDAADSMCMLLAAFGHTCETAYDGFQAIDRAQHFHPDVVFLDIGMPGIDGYETARRMRAEPWGTALRLYALTGWGQEDARRQSRDAGFDRHFVKPVDPGTLARELEDGSATFRHLHRDDDHGRRT